MSFVTCPASSQNTLISFLQQEGNSTQPFVVEEYEATNLLKMLHTLPRPIGSLLRKLSSDDGMSTTTTSLLDFIYNKEGSYDYLMGVLSLWIIASAILFVWILLLITCRYSHYTQNKSLFSGKRPAPNPPPTSLKAMRKLQRRSRRSRSSRRSRRQRKRRNRLLQEHQKQQQQGSNINNATETPPLSPTQSNSSSHDARSSKGTNSTTKEASPLVEDYYYPHNKSNNSPFNIHQNGDCAVAALKADGEEDYFDTREQQNRISMQQQQPQRSSLSLVKPTSSADAFRREASSSSSQQQRNNSTNNINVTSKLSLPSLVTKRRFEEATTSFSSLRNNITYPRQSWITTSTPYRFEETTNGKGMIAYSSPSKLAVTDTDTDTNTNTNTSNNNNTKNKNRVSAARLLRYHHYLLENNVGDSGSSSSYSSGLSFRSTCNDNDPDDGCESSSSSCNYDGNNNLNSNNGKGEAQQYEQQEDDETDDDNNIVNANKATTMMEGSTARLFQTYRNYVHERKRRGSASSSSSQSSRPTAVSLSDSSSSNDENGDKSSPGSRSADNNPIQDDETLECSRIPSMQQQPQQQQHQQSSSLVESCVDDDSPLTTRCDLEQNAHDAAAVVVSGLIQTSTTYDVDRVQMEHYIRDDNNPNKTNKSSLECSRIPMITMQQQSLSIESCDDESPPTTKPSSQQHNRHDYDDDDAEVEVAVVPSSKTDDQVVPLEYSIGDDNNPNNANGSCFERSGIPSMQQQQQQSLSEVESYVDDDESIATGCSPQQQKQNHLHDDEEVLAVVHSSSTYKQSQSEYTQGGTVKEEDQSQPNLSSDDYHHHRHRHRDDIETPIMIPDNELEEDEEEEEEEEEEEPRTSSTYLDATNHLHNNKSNRNSYSSLTNTNKTDYQQPKEYKDKKELTAAWKQWSKQEKRYDFQMQIFRILISFFMGVLIISSILFTLQGTSNLNKQIDHIQEVWYDLQDRVYQFDYQIQYLGQQLDASNLLEQTRDVLQSLNHFCPAVRHGGICSPSFLNNETSTINECNLTGLPSEDLWSDWLELVVKQRPKMDQGIANRDWIDMIQLDVDHILSGFDALMTTTTPSATDFWNWAWLTTTICNYVLAGLTLIILLFTSLFDSNTNGTTRSNVLDMKWFGIIWWVFVFFAWTFATVFWTGTIVTADACSGGGGDNDDGENDIYNPNNVTTAFLDNHDITTADSYLMGGYLEYYIGGCKAEAYPTAIHNQVSIWTNLLPAMQNLIKSMELVDRNSFVQTCGTSLNPLINATWILNSQLCTVTDQMVDIWRLLDCDQWHPYYDAVVNEAICRQGSQGLVWATATQIIILVSAFFIWTLRAAFLPMREISG